MKLLIILMLSWGLACYPEREKPPETPESPPQTTSDKGQDAGAGPNEHQTPVVDAGHRPDQVDAGAEEWVPTPVDAGQTSTGQMPPDAGGEMVVQDAGTVAIDATEPDSGFSGLVVEDAGTPTCSAGFVWSAASSACQDVNECEAANGGCEHDCSNTAGGYECACDAGHTLNNDGLTCDTPQERAEAIAQSFGVGEMAIWVDIDDVIEQDAMGDVKFEEAFYRALDSFLTDGTDDESPIQWVIAFDGDAGALKEYMNEAGMWLVPNRERLSPDAWYPPEYGESIDNYWVFFMTSDAELNALFWALVPRDGSATYNYGFD